MEYINKIELQGMTGKSCQILIHAGKPYGFRFSVVTERTIPATVKGEGPTIETRWHDVKVLPTVHPKTRDFVFCRERPIHIIGDISYTAQHKLNETTYTDIYIEATEVEYLEPENKKED